MAHLSRTHHFSVISCCISIFDGYTPCKSLFHNSYNCHNHHHLSMRVLFIAFERLSTGQQLAIQRQVDAWHLRNDKATPGSWKRMYPEQISHKAMAIQSGLTFFMIAIKTPPKRPMAMVNYSNNSIVVFFVFCCEIMIELKSSKSLDSPWYQTTRSMPKSLGVTPRNQEVTPPLANLHGTTSLWYGSRTSSCLCILSNISSLNSACFDQPAIEQQVKRWDNQINFEAPGLSNQLGMNICHGGDGQTWRFQANQVC